MNQSLQKALFHLTERQDINEVSAEELETLTTKYPYFAITHLLLAKKLQATGSSDLATQVQRTSLYIDPFWLQYQLSEDKELDISKTTISVDDAKEVASSPQQQAEEIQVIPDQFHPEPELIQEEIESGEEIPVGAPADGENASDPSDFSATDDISAEVPKAVSISEEELVEDEILLQKITHHEDVKMVENLPLAYNNSEESGVPVNSELEGKVTEGIETHQIFSKDIEAKTNALINPPETPEGEVPFEPYHTIDYFASQGIQLVLENDPQDKLGKQLKKFTQWLKHMKRLGPEDALEAVKDTHLESTIQDIADSSNTPRDIVTETMADVLVKQGKIEQAIQLYDKLSFLNPGKSAYFAAKIHTLKGS